MIYCTAKTVYEIANMVPSWHVQQTVPVRKVCTEMDVKPLFDAVNGMLDGALTVNPALTLVVALVMYFSALVMLRQSLTGKGKGVTVE